MSLNYLNTTNFYSYARFTASDVNSGYVTYIIGKINSLIDAKLEHIFSLSTDFTQKYYQRNSESIVIVGTWQESGLTVVHGTDNGDETTLTVSDDYRLLKVKDDIPNQTYPVNAIRLYTYYVSENTYLKLTGTYGYSDGVPSDVMLDVQIYDLLKKAIMQAENDTSTSGKGSIQSSKIGKISVSYGDTSNNSSINSTQELFRAVEQAIDVVASDYEVDYTNFMSVLG